jgi:hypothetical protein
MRAANVNPIDFFALNRNPGDSRNPDDRGNDHRMRWGFAPANRCNGYVPSVIGLFELSG